MSDYCTYDQIRSQHKLLKDAAVVPDTPSVPGQVNLNDCRAEAQRRIDAVLAGSFVVPFTSPVPVLIVDICKHLSAALALSKMSSAISPEEDNPGERMIKSDMRYLDDIRDGRVTLVDYTASQPNDNIGPIGSGKPTMTLQGDNPIDW